MKSAVFFGVLCLVPFVLGMTRDELIDQAVSDMDANGDGIITESEMHSEFLVLMDVNSESAFVGTFSDDLYAEYSERHSRPLYFSHSKMTYKDWILTKEEFTDAETGWSAFYGESQEISAAFFDNLDMACLSFMRNRRNSGCGWLGPLDLIMIYEMMDTDGDYQVTTEQLTSLMQELYPPY